MHAILQKERTASCSALVRSPCGVIETLFILLPRERRGKKNQRNVYHWYRKVGAKLWCLTRVMMLGKNQRVSAKMHPGLLMENTCFLELFMHTLVSGSSFYGSFARYMEDNEATQEFTRYHSSTFSACSQCQIVWQTCYIRRERQRKNEVLLCLGNLSYPRVYNWWGQNLTLKSFHRNKLAVSIKITVCVSVSHERHIEISQAGQLKQQNFACLQLWRLKV